MSRESIVNEARKNKNKNTTDSDSDSTSTSASESESQRDAGGSESGSGSEEDGVEFRQTVGDMRYTMFADGAALVEGPDSLDNYETEDDVPGMRVTHRMSSLRKMVRVRKAAEKFGMSNNAMRNMLIEQGLDELGIEIDD